MLIQFSIHSAGHFDAQDRCLVLHQPSAWAERPSGSPPALCWAQRSEALLLPGLQLEWRVHHGMVGTRKGYHLVMTNIAMENPRTQWWFIAGKIIYKWAIFHGYVK